MATFNTKTNTLTIDDNENDRWIRTLPGYKGEVELSEKLSKKLNPKYAKVIRKRNNNGKQD